MRVVLDTHTWIWWMSEPVLLSRGALSAITDATVIGISAMSCWEVASLVRRGRLGLEWESSTWVSHALRHDVRVIELPVTTEIALLGGSLDARFPGDPSDRLIYATARVGGVPLITRDTRIRGFDPDRTVW